MASLTQDTLPATYQTVGGDMWDWISFQLYGTEYNADQLQYANPEYATVWVFDSGVTLTVPKINVVIPTNNPPWIAIS